MGLTANGKLETANLYLINYSHSLLFGYYGLYT
jgi:hypothetical protein